MTTTTDKLAEALRETLGYVRGVGSAGVYARALAALAEYDAEQAKRQAAQLRSWGVPEA